MPFDAGQAKAALSGPMLMPAFWAQAAGSGPPAFGQLRSFGNPVIAKLALLAPETQA